MQSNHECYEAAVTALDREERSTQRWSLLPLRQRVASTPRSRRGSGWCVSEPASTGEQRMLLERGYTYHGLATFAKSTHCSTARASSRSVTQASDRTEEVIGDSQIWIAHFNGEARVGNSNLAAEMQGSARLTRGSKRLTLAGRMFGETTIQRQICWRTREECNRWPRPTTRTRATTPNAWRSVQIPTNLLGG